MSQIKTWREREFEANGYVAVSPASNVIYMKAEIDALRQAIEQAGTCAYPEVCPEHCHEFYAAPAQTVGLPRSNYCVKSTGESLYTETQVLACLAAPTTPAQQP